MSTSDPTPSGPTDTGARDDTAGPGGSAPRGGDGTSDDSATPAAAAGDSGSAARWAELFAELGAPSSGAADPADGVPTGGECAEALGQMFEYLDGEVSDRTAAGRIAEHLGLCSTCLAAYDTEKLVRAALVRSCRAETASVELRSRISVLIRAGDTSR